MKNMLLLLKVTSCILLLIANQYVAGEDSVLGANTEVGGDEKTTIASNASGVVPEIGLPISIGNGLLNGSVLANVSNDLVKVSSSLSGGEQKHTNIGDKFLQYLKPICDSVHNLGDKQMQTIQNQFQRFAGLAAIGTCFIGELVHLVKRTEILNLCESQGNGTISQKLSDLISCFRRHNSAELARQLNAITDIRTIASSDHKHANDPSLNAVLHDSDDMNLISQVVQRVLNRPNSGSAKSGLRTGDALSLDAVAPVSGQHITLHKHNIVRDTDITLTKQTNSSKPEIKITESISQLNATNESDPPAVSPSMPTRTQETSSNFTKSITVSGSTQAPASADQFGDRFSTIPDVVGGLTGAVLQTASAVLTTLAPKITINPTIGNDTQDLFSALKVKLSIIKQADDKNGQPLSISASNGNGTSLTLTSDNSNSLLGNVVNGTLGGIVQQVGISGGVNAKPIISKTNDNNLLDSMKIKLSVHETASQPSNSSNVTSENNQTTNDDANQTSSVAPQTKPTTRPSVLVTSSIAPQTVTISTTTLPMIVEFGTGEPKSLKIILNAKNTGSSSASATNHDQKTTVSPGSKDNSTKSTASTTGTPGKQPSTQAPSVPAAAPTTTTTTSPKSNVTSTGAPVQKPVDLFEQILARQEKDVAELESKHKAERDNLLKQIRKIVSNSGQSVANQSVKISELKSPIGTLAKAVSKELDKVNNSSVKVSTNLNVKSNGSQKDAHQLEHERQMAIDPVGHTLKHREYERAKQAEKEKEKERSKDKSAKESKSN